MKDRKNIAFIGVSFLGVGGVEKTVQQIAIELAREGHNIDFFYTRSTYYPRTERNYPGENAVRKKLVEDAGINTIPVECGWVEGIKDDWNETNLFDLFKPENYDLVIGSHKGEASWPFYIIKGPKIIEISHGTAYDTGASNYADGYALITKYQIPLWENAGGDMSKTRVVPHLMIIDEPEKKNDRERWGLPEDKLLFGFHQAARKGLHSPIPLAAYAEIESDENYFVLLGGGEEWKVQADELGIKNFLQLPLVSSSEEINSLLSCLDVYTHGRMDGEVSSTAILEAMANGLPIVTHRSIYNNGHLTQIDGCACLCAQNSEEYAIAMRYFENNKSVREEVGRLIKEKYENEFSYSTCRDLLVDFVNDVLDESL
jgi:glycosyltransferase involved in cell wall biosynthesis